MAGEAIARRVLIHGRVQGVFFRDSLRQMAEASGVGGWASNRDDGTLEAHLEGPPEAVRRLVEFCREGPPQAQVDHVDVRETEAQSESGFRIR